MSKVFDLYSFERWLLERQRHHERLARSETTNQMVRLVHETRALLLYQIRTETDRFLEEAEDE